MDALTSRQKHYYMAAPLSIEKPPGPLPPAAAAVVFRGIRGGSLLPAAQFELG